MNETGFYDAHGIPIHVGDLIRVKHFKHHRNHRQMWLYFRVGIREGVLVAEHWERINTGRHQCLLQDVGLHDSEVLSEALIHRNKRGEIITFNERPRLKKQGANS